MVYAPKSKGISYNGHKKICTVLGARRKRPWNRLKWSSANKEAPAVRDYPGAWQRTSVRRRCRIILSYFPAHCKNECSEMEENFMDYKEVVKLIEDSEKRVDEVLKAARLERHERQPMSRDMLAMILNYIVGTLAMIMGFAALYMLMYYCNH